jgi:hypothetical protein
MQTGTFTNGLSTVVGDYDKLLVEDYQRSYSWQADQIEELFEDLKECVKSRENHFFGTLILQQSDPSSKVATIVDGQQRLTTVFILVSVLRDEIRILNEHEIKPEKANLKPINVLDKAWTFLCASDDLTNHRFESSRFLRDLMKNHVLAEPDNRQSMPKRDKAITLQFRKGVTLIEDLVRRDLTSFPNSHSKLVRINELLDALMKRFIVLRVPTTSLSESLDIFLTLNNRGLPLGPSDLVRGQLMNILGQNKSEAEQAKLQRRILEEWQVITENVGDPEAFLRHYLVSTSKEKVQKKKVVSSVMELLRGDDLNTKQGLAEAFWYDLSDASITYSQIITPSMGGETQCQIELLEGLLKSHRIILLSAMRSQVDDLTKSELIRLVFVLSYKWIMAGKNAQKLEDFFQSQCWILKSSSESNESLIYDAQEVINNLREAISNITVNPLLYFSNDADSSFISRALLYYVNRSCTHGANTMALDSKKLNIEHIAPQSDTDNWLDMVFDGDQSQYDDYETVISSIGNLTLLDHGLNKQIQCKPFADKKSHYKKSTMDIARDLQEFERWDKPTIQLRTRWLTEMFEILWSAERTKLKVIRFSEWYQSKT